ncbi:uncharacterized protein LOC144660060 [Oculina patagonica]
MGSGFASVKLNAVRSVRDHRTLAVDGVPILLGLNHSEMTPITEVEAVATSGKSRHTTESNQTGSIASAFKRRKEARSVKELEARAPVGASTPLGPNISVMTPTTEVVAVVTLGRSSLNGYRVVTSRCAECASKKQREALSAREIAKAAVNGARGRTKMVIGPCHSEMIQMGALGAVLIGGIWIAPHQFIPP